MTDPTSEMPRPEQPSPPPVGSELQVQSPFTPIPQDSGVKWRTVAIPIVLFMVGTAWFLGWLVPLADLVSPVLCPVSGTVLYNGKPLTRGFVQTIYERGGVMGTLGPIQADGTFELSTNGDPGAYSGRHRVIVSNMDGGMPPKSLLPEKYSDPRNSPFTIHVSRSRPNKMHLELEDEKTP